MEGIREAIRHSREIVNKAHLFDSDMKEEGHLSAQKIVMVLVKFGHKMEATLEEMRKLLPALPAAARSSQPPTPEATPETPREKTMQQLFDEMKECIQQQKVEEAVAAAARIEISTPAVRLTKEVEPSIVPVASPSAKGKKMETEIGSKVASSKPASLRSGKKKEKEPIPEIQELEEEEESSTGDATGSEEGEVPSTPPPEQQAKGREMRSSSRKKKLVYGSPFAPKRTAKTTAKEEGSNKKPRGK